jgi:hypothetical protein
MANRARFWIACAVLCCAVTPAPALADVPGATNYVSQALKEAMDGKPVTLATSRPHGCSVKYAN